MPWIEGNCGGVGNETTKIINVEDAFEITPSMSGAKSEVRLDFRGGLTQSPLLVFRGSTDAFNAYMKKLRKALPATWFESLGGSIINLSVAVGIETCLVEGHFEVIADFELDTSRSLSRNLFRTAYELLFNNFVDDLRAKLPSFWIETLEGYLVNLSVSSEIEIRLQDAEKRVIAKFLSQEYIILKTETEKEIEAFVEDLTPALMSEQGVI